MPRFVFRPTRFNRIPFYQTRSAIDIRAGLESFKQRTANQVIDISIPQVSAAVIPQAIEQAAQAAQLAVLTTIADMQRAAARGKSYSPGISSGAGYKGGTSAAAKSILSSYNKARGK